jgi:DNA-binding NarL/FixJ family response regulator
VALIDPDAAYHRICQEWLANSADFEFISLGAALRGTSDRDTQPSHDALLVALDGHPADHAGLEHLRAWCAITTVLVLVETVDWPGLTLAVQSGARGYLLKPSEPGPLVSALNTARAGGHLLCERAQALVFTVLRQRFADVLKAGLSPREREVLLHLVSGLENKQIMAVTGLGFSTVITHVHNILGKYGVHSRRELQSRYLSS